MNCKENFIEIPDDNPFANDLFGRTSYGQFVHKIVDSYSKSGAVIALNGEWGSGKTTFLRMWGKKLELQGYRTLFFNAWQCDFHDDPMIALMGELIQQFGNNKSKDELIEKGARLISAAAKCALKGIVKKTINVDLDDIISEATDIVRESILRYHEDKNLLNDFKDSLTKLVAEPKSEKPVVFIIDELDRCNPHFSIKLLERLKHVFEVPGIVFVLGVNMDQMQYAVQGFFRSNFLDGGEYLKRFFDLELKLPVPNLIAYCNFLFETQDLNLTFETRDQYGWTARPDAEKETFSKCACDIFKAYNLNLRAVFRLTHYTRIVVGSLGYTPINLADLVFFLCFLRVNNHNLFNKIKYHQVSIQELLSEIELLLPKSLLVGNSIYGAHRRMVWLIAKLLLSYNFLDDNDQRFDNNFFGSVSNESKFLRYPVSTTIMSEDSLNEALHYFEKNYNLGQYISINKILPVVELTNVVEFI